MHIFGCWYACVVLITGTTHSLHGHLVLYHMCIDSIKVLFPAILYVLDHTKLQVQCVVNFLGNFNVVFYILQVPRGIVEQ